MKQINIQHEANMTAEGKLNSKKCKPVICLDTGEVFTSMTDAAEYANTTTSNMVVHLNGKTRQVKGKRYCYLSRVNESLDSIVTRLRETAAMEDDARKWRVYHAEQEAIRIANEKREEAERKAKEKHDAELAKARAKVARLNETLSRLEAEYAEASQRLNEAEMALEALEDEEG